MNRFDSTYSLQRGGRVPLSLRTLLASLALVAAMFGLDVRAIAQPSLSATLSPSPSTVCAPQNVTYTWTITNPPKMVTYPGAGGGVINDVANAAVTYAPDRAGNNYNDILAAANPGNNNDDFVYLVNDANLTLTGAAGGGDFNFRFFGTTYNLTDNGFYIGANGFIRFRDSYTTAAQVTGNVNAGAFDLAANAAPWNTIAALSTDLAPQGQGNVAGEDLVGWEIVDDNGAAAGASLVISWYDVSQFNPALAYPFNRVRVQLILRSDNHATEANQFIIQVEDLPDPGVAGRTFTIGAENSCQVAKNIGDEYSVAEDGAGNQINQAAWNAGIEGNQWTFVPTVGANQQYTWTIKNSVGGGVLATGTSSNTTDNTTFATSYIGAYTYPPIAETNSHYVEIVWDNLNDNCERIESPVTSFTVKPTPPANPIQINGVAQATGYDICNNTSYALSLTQDNSASAHTYAWTLTSATAGVTYTFSNATGAATNLSVFMPAAGGDPITVTVSCVETNPLGCTTTNTIDYDVHQTPGALTIAQTAGGTICAVSGGPYTFQATTAVVTPAVTTMNYQWSATSQPSGSTVGFTAPTSASTDVTFGSFPTDGQPKSVTLQCVATNATSGCSSTGSLTITVNTTVPVNSVTASATWYCGQTTVVFSLPPVAGATYTWEVIGNPDLAVPNTTSATRNGAVITTGASTTFVAGDTVHITFTDPTSTTNNRTTWIVDAVVTPAGNCGPVNQTHATTYQIYNPTTAAAPAFPSTSGARRVTAAPTYDVVDAAGALCLRNTGSENYAVFDIDVPTPMGDPDRVFFQWDGTDGIVDEILFANAAGTVLHTFSNPAENTDLSNDPNTVVVAGTYKLFVHFTATGNFRIRSGQEQNYLTPLWCQTLSPWSSSVTINALPAAPVVATTGYCVAATLDSVTTNTPAAGVTHTINSITGAAAITSNAPQTSAAAGQPAIVEVTNWGGNATATVVATALNTTTNCTETSTTVITIGALPVANVATGDANACAYPTDPTGVAGNTIDLAYAKEYTAGSSAAGDIFSWSLTNGYIAQYSTDGGGTWTTVGTVGQTLGYTVDATKIKAVFFGASPGDVKYTRLDPSSNCLATSTPLNVTFVTPAAITLSGGTNFCATNAGTFALTTNTSTVGINYQLEVSTNGGAFTPVTPVTVVAGSGAALTFTENNSSYPAGASTINTYQFRVMGYNGAVAACDYGPSNSVTVRVTPQPADVPVTATVSACTGGTATIAIGNGGSPSESFVTYTVQVSPAGAGTWTTLGTIDGNGTGAANFTHTPLPAGAVPTATTPNFEYRVSASTNTATSVYNTCTTPLTQQPTIMIFSNPTNPTVTTSTGTTYCWNTSATNLVTIDLASTQLGVSYDVMSSTTGATVLATIVGDGSPMSVSIPVNAIQTTNPTVPVTSSITVDARITNATYPSTTCVTTYAGPTLTINPRPNDLLPVSLSPIRVCEGTNLTVTVTGIEANTTYALYYTDAPTPTSWTLAAAAPSSISGSTATFSVSAPSIASPNPLQSTPNYQYKVVATYNATSCSVDLQTQPDVTVFDTPADPSASVTSAPTCWTSTGNVVVRLASTQDGVRYNIKNGGTQIETVLPGAGANIDVTIPLTTIIAANPASGSQAISITVDAILVQEGAFTRPVPVTGCLTNYAVTNGTFVVYSTPTDKTVTMSTTAVCAGGTVVATISNPESFAEYQLSRSTSPAGPFTPVTGIGFGWWSTGGPTLNISDVPPSTTTDITAPSHYYRVDARNFSSTGCTATMSTIVNTYAYGAISTAVGVSVSPAQLCAVPGTATFTVTLTGTQNGVTYTVKNADGSAVGTIEGTGGTASGTFAQSTLAAGSVVVGGSSYLLNVEGRLSTTGIFSARPTPAGGCAATMAASTSIVVNTLPSNVTVSAASTLCLPGSLVLTLSNTNAFATYTIDRTTNGGTSWTTVVNNASYTGPITDASLTGGDPVNGLAWTYRVTAVNGACTNVQSNVHTVTVYNELNKTYTPTVVGVTGGSTNKVCYEAGNTFKVTLSGSQVGVNYEFKIGGTTYATVAGTGAAIETGALDITAVGLTAPGAGNGGVTNYTVSVDASRSAAPSCTVTLNSTAAGKAIHKLPASTPVTATPAIGCEFDTYTITIGPLEPYFWISVFDGGLAAQGTAGSFAGWNAATKTVTLTTTLTGGGPLTSAPNHQWVVTGWHGSEAGGGFCETTLTAQPTQTVFALPTNVTTTASPSEACWPTGTTVTADNTQDGIVYSLERFNGASWVATGLTVNGTGGTVTIDVPYTTLQAPQATIPVTVQLRLIGTLRTGVAPYDRPIPASACATVVGTTSVLVNPKPIITVVAGQSWNGSSTVSTPTVNENPICAQNQYTAAGPWTYRDYSVSFNTVLAATQPSTYAWTVLTETAGDILDRTGMNTIAPTIAWGIYPAAVAAPNITTETLQVIATTSTNCADTATYNVTIYPTLGDAVLSHNLGNEACVYNDWTPARSVFTLNRTATGISGYPDGTSFNWAVTHPREATNPPSYAIYGVGNSNTLQVEWLQPSTQTGTASDSATVTVTATLPASWGGCATTRTFNVFVHTTPTPAFLSGETEVCPNSTHTYAAVQNTNNTYAWEVVGGTIAGGAGAGTATNPSTLNTGTGNSISVTWGAANTSAQVRLIEINEAGCQSQITRTVTITAPPTPFIRGPIISCLGATESYDVEQNYLSTYAWSMSPANAGIPVAGWNTSNEIQIQWNLVGTHTLTVVETNNLGCVTSSSRDITVNQTPVQTAINGAAIVCQGSEVAYSVAPVAGQSYNWTVTGGSIVSGQGTGGIIVNWSALGNQTVTVDITTDGTPCTKTLTQNVNVTYQPAPVVAGVQVACIDKTHIYSTPETVGSTYNWTITPANAFQDIAGFPGDNVIEVRWIQTGLHTVSVTETSLGGYCSATASIEVRVNPIPTPAITSTTGYGAPATRRPGVVCNGSTHTYTVDPTADNVFQWAVTGGTILAGQNTNTITVQWGATGTGTIACTETVPGSDCITTDVDQVDIRPTPTPQITGEVNPCGNTTFDYTTPLVDGNTYTWSAIGGTGVQTAPNTFRVTWTAPVWPNTTAASVTVREDVADVAPAGSCFATTTLNVTLRPIPPVPTITGPTVVCATDLNTTPATVNTASYTSSIPAITGASGSLTPTWSVTGGTIVSGQGTLTLNVQWTNNGSTPVTGTVSVLHTSSFGCAATGTLNVTVNPLPTPSIVGATSACQNTVENYSTVGVPGNTYVWSLTGGNIIRSGQGTPNVAVEWTLPGVATLTVSETNSFGCTVLNQREVTVNALPQATLEVSGPTTFCQGGDVTISAPIGFANYVWNTGETARSIVVRTTGKYWVVVTDENGCSNRSDTVTVNVFPSALPIVTISGPLTFCEGGSVTLTAPAGFNAYLWSNGETTQTITVTESGSYTVSVSDGNGCTGTSTEVDVTVYDAPTPTLTVVGGPFCAGDSASVSAPAGYVSYTWVSQNGLTYGTERNIVVTASDVIYCQVVDINGCTGVSDTVNLVFTRVETPVVVLNGPATFCEGGAVTLTAPEGYASYVWSNGAVGRTITVDQAGEYFVTVATATCPAVSAKTTITVNNLPAIPTIQRMGDVLTANSTAATAYQWIRNGVDMPGADAKQLTVNLPGAYRVRITDANGCENTSEAFDVILTDVNDDVVAGFQAPLRISPNPTNGRFTIETTVNEAGPVRIELVNALGELVMTLNETSVAGNFRAAVDMGTLSAGAYNVVVTAGNQRWVARMVRQ